MTARGKRVSKLVGAKVLARTDLAVKLDCHDECWVPLSAVISERVTIEPERKVFNIAKFDKQNGFKAWKKLKALKPDELQRLLNV